jgi:multimeric flavodoxin WrbA
MKVCIIYHSETGNTRHVAQHLSSAIVDSHLIEVFDRARYTFLTRYLVRCKKSRSEEKTDIEPSHLDVAGFDLIVFGSPVWAFKPTPVIHTAIDHLKGCEKERVVAFVTHGGRPGQSEVVFRTWIEQRGMQFCGFLGINQKEIEDDKVNAALLAVVTAAGKK